MNAGFEAGEVVAVRALGRGRVELSSLDALFEKHRGRLASGGSYQPPPRRDARRVGLTLVDSSAAIAYLDKDDSLHASAANAIETAVRRRRARAVGSQMG